MSTGETVTVRFFAAAEEAAGVDEAARPLAEGETLRDVIDGLVRAAPALAGVLCTCSYLRNGVAVRDARLPLEPGDVVDVLPPFSGG
ncbi:thiamineS protein [Segniliparus rotundus DSM 44985]|uniref:Molybdopterin synthase sulfur carrier subunit n=1 Tax=Segniliparus rotundus (strain ATCC BAA-972 / CDC 1076 / CIP 108378 / DSM 44985 / JCM 13578) TaxID=640132 RepID=D6ZDN2_SEGRD|nr:MoaD/ThiS family protein [Segniliparus rotundus]ADG99289.1 thiamineS protein [Segniliparus rotundus DSM 44985]